MGCAREKYFRWRCAHSSWSAFCAQAQFVSPTERKVPMVRELQFLSVGFVFVFLGAIVLGVF